MLSDKEEGGGRVEGADEIGLEVTGEGRLEGEGEGGGGTGGLMVGHLGIGLPLHPFLRDFRTFTFWIFFGCPTADTQKL